MGSERTPRQEAALRAALAAGHGDEPSSETPGRESPTRLEARFAQRTTRLAQTASPGAAPLSPWVAILLGFVLTVPGAFMLAVGDVDEPVAALVAIGFLTAGSLLVQIGVIAAGVVMAHRTIRWAERPR